jgi:hypothetical protein
MSSEEGNVVRLSYREKVSTVTMKEILSLSLQEIITALYPIVSWLLCIRLPTIYFICNDGVLFFQ